MRTIKCSKCSNKIAVKLIGKSSNSSFVYLDDNGFKIFGKICRHCRNRAMRDSWHSGIRKQINWKYEMGSPKGYLVRKYRNMLSRVSGVQQKKSHLYLGKTILPKVDFYAWALNNNDFVKLWDNYLSAKRNRKLAPTVNRIDPQKGYTLDNMEWITHSQNSSLANRTRKFPKP